MKTPLCFILSAFAWAYVLAQVPGGALLDRFGTKRIYAGAIALWSLFTAMQGFVGLVPMLSAVAPYRCGGRGGPGAAGRRVHRHQPRSPCWRGRPAGRRHWPTFH